MKNSIPLVLCSMLLALFTISCNDASEEVVSAVPDTKLSEIDLLEKEMGVSLFKAEITLTDDANTNTLTLKVASQDEGELNRYLSNNDFSIEPVYSIEQPQQLTAGSQVDQGQKTVVDPSNRIYSEVLDQSMAPGVIGYRIHIRKNTRATGRTHANGYTYRLTLISGDWPTYFGLNSLVNTGVSFWVQLPGEVPFDSAEICNEFTDYCDFYHTNLGFNLYALQGYRKAQAFVDYNDIADLVFYDFL